MSILRALALSLSVVLVGGCAGDPAPELGNETAQRSSLPDFGIDDGRARMERLDDPAPGLEPGAAALAYALARLPRTARDAGHGLRVRDLRRGLAGTYVRLARTFAGLRVFEREVVVLLVGSPGAYRARALNPGAAPILEAPLRADRGEAFVRALVADRLEVDPDAIAIERGVWPAPRPALAYRALATTASGDWELVVAGDGTLLIERDRRRFADGTGFVFDPNPVASTGSAALADNNDATSSELDGARLSVTLPRLDGSGFLRGAYADVRPKSAAQRAQSATLSFEFSRDADGFEEVMAYYHIDRAQDYLQAVLGFTDVNNRVQIATVNSSNQDNSYYAPGSGELDFGAGGVDDAEDAEIIWHEYGHAIQDNQVPGYGGGDEGAMGEGFGDYFAASLADALTAQVKGRACVAEWDATSYIGGADPCLRRVDSTKHFPEAATGEVHDDGEMWSAALFAAREEVGAEVMDKLVIESHFLLTSDESMASASQAIEMTEATLFGGAHAASVRRHLVWQGVSRELADPAPLTAVADSMPLELASPQAGGTYRNLIDDIQTVEVTGAEALRLHFAALDTQDDPQCLDGGCDNVYLYDGEGRLYQILHGALGALDSVVIPGPRIDVRLVTDSRGGRPGYRIDRVDVMTSGAGRSDAGMGEPGADGGLDAGAGGDGDGGGCGCGVGANRDGGWGASVLAFLVLLGCARRKQGADVAPSAAPRGLASRSQTWSRRRR